MTSLSPEFTIRRDVPQTMRDGTILRADVYLPKGTGPFPALLERTPYSKDNSPECQVGSPPFFATNGYAVVIQDVRGRFASEGRFIPFHDDGWGVNRDGYDTVEWIAAQPWCDGNVGTIGGSYAGATQYRLAPTRPPHLRAMYVRESSADYWAEWVYHGGAFELGFMVEWTLKWTYNNLPRLARSPEEQAQRRGVLEKALQELPSWHRELPLHPNPLVEGLDDWYNEFLAHPDDGPFWWRWNIAQRHGDIDTPIVHMGGWFDIFLAGTIKNFTGTRAKARTQAARDAQRLVVGPWIHGPWNMAQTVQGEVDFGGEAIRDYNAIRLPWFDHWMRGARNSRARRAPRPALRDGGEPLAQPPTRTRGPGRARRRGTSTMGRAWRRSRRWARSKRTDTSTTRRTRFRPRAARRSTSRAAPATSGPSRDAVSPTPVRPSSGTSR